jgi:hypothetical protein
MKKTLSLALVMLLLVASLSVALAETAVKHGLGMSTEVGSLAEATAEKPGTAQVNTTVCSLVLDAEGKILSVKWDVQQTKITFSVDGKPGEIAAELKTKIEKGDEYGMRKASAIGKEWFEQMEAFEAYCVGKTVEEVLGMETFKRDDNHPFVPASPDFATTVTMNVGEYLETLEKAAANAM